MPLKKSEMMEDLIFLLYLFPLFLNGLYALYLWFQRGITLSLPSEVYLAVTKDHAIFLMGVLAIVAALIIEVRMSPVESRAVNVGKNVSRMRVLAYFCVVTSLISTWSASGYSLSILDIYLEGGYAMLYPAFLLFLSLALSSPIRKFLKLSPILFDLLPIVLIVFSPLSLYMLWRLGLPSSLVFSISLLIFIAGIAILLYGPKLKEKSKPKVKQEE
ncbi:MAG: hypothetical protein HXX80_00405 [Nitrososphaerales archaeon]|nr:hypothetical protein [Nitrososphaerales archaeon]